MNFEYLEKTLFNNSIQYNKYTIDSKISYKSKQNYNNNPIWEFYIFDSCVLIRYYDLITGRIIQISYLTDSAQELIKTIQQTENKIMILNMFDELKNEY